MPQRCTVCDHPERQAIDESLAVGVVSKRSLASRYGLQDVSIGRHEKHHLPESLVLSAKAAEIGSATRLLSRVDRLASRLERLAEAADESRHGAALLQVSRELRPALELLGRVTGEIQSNNVSAFILQLGARDEGEVRRALELARGSGDVTLESCREDALDLVLLAATQDPEWRTVVVSRLQREPSEAVVVESNGHPEAA